MYRVSITLHRHQQLLQEWTLRLTTPRGEILLPLISMTVLQCSKVSMHMYVLGIKNRAPDRYRVESVRFTDCFAGVDMSTRP